MNKLEFHPENAIGDGILQLDKQELLQFVSRLCLHVKAEVGSRAYRGGIFPENICVNDEGEYAIGPARLEKWSGQELEFVAPELYWHGETGPASDVYSLALLVYYGLGEGKLPFETASASGQLARMSGKALPAPKNAGKRLAEVLEKATAFRTADRYQSPEELQIMLESCMDNKYLGGASGAETVFRKEDGQLSEIERMMVDIIERGEDERPTAEEPELSIEGMSVEEIAGLEKPKPLVQEPEDVHAMVEEFFGGLGDPAPEPAPENGEPEDVRVYEPGREKRERQPIPILTEEKHPELEPVVLQQQPRYGRGDYGRNNANREEEPRQEPRPIAEQEVKKRRSLRPLAVVLCLCLALVAGALAVNLYWNRGVRPTQINPTPDPQKLFETEQPAPEEPGAVDPQNPALVVPEVTETAHRYEIVVSDMSWTQAQAACWEKGAHLAVVSSREELDQITALAREQGITHLWIGCRRLNGELVWENDETTDFFLWAPNEPSFMDGYDNVQEDFIMLFREGDEWRYNDSRNDPAADYPAFYQGTMGFVCEYEG